ncbi:DUF421 domain-containing protein [Nocardioides gilvus]|uniref:DUF421 domain-containing protein n=1 Tax=Nocardioides gilvus TaxID=1735589 RepID=UPI000D74C38A|nr:YetF domain-containing protein [Nocardioides gilvus]
MWFDTWADLGRILAVGSAAYVTLVVVLRFSGKRTLAKLNAFDLVVTVALGSTLATILLNRQIAWADGATALALLAALQLVVAFTGSRVPRLRTAVTAQPTWLLRDGVVDRSALRQQRLTMSELRQAVRSSGRGSLEDVAAVVLESDGTLSVIGADQFGNGSALDDLSDS